jgi:hypothetical protein
MTDGKVRRVVTGFDADGRAIIVSDGDAPTIKAVPGRPGYYSINVWRTGAAPVSVTEPTDPAERARQLKASFGEIFDDAER